VTFRAFRLDGKSAAACALLSRFCIADSTPPGYFSLNKCIMHARIAGGASDDLHLEIDAQLAACSSDRDTN